MRQIVLDTETTGLDPATGDRIVEIGAVELLNHLPTGRTFHVYINPERDMPTGAQDVHGLTEEFLSDKPLFAARVDELLDFLGDAANYAVSLAVVGSAIAWRARAALMKSLFMLGFAAWVLGSAVVAFMNGTAPDGVMMGTIGGLALAALASVKGARILRVHDVAETVDVVRMIAAVESAE